MAVVGLAFGTQKVDAGGPSDRAVHQRIESEMRLDLEDGVRCRYSAQREGYGRSPRPEDALFAAYPGTRSESLSRVAIHDRLVVLRVTDAGGRRIGSYLALRQGVDRWFIVRAERAAGCDRESDLAALKRVGLI